MRPSLSERLRIAKEAHAKAVEKVANVRLTKTEVATLGVLTLVLPKPPDVMRAPLCACGCRMVECPDCRAHYCRANGHARHVCAAFSQVAE